MRGAVAATSSNNDPSDQNSMRSLYDDLREVMGSKHSEESIRLLSDDFLVFGGGGHIGDVASRGGDF